MLLSIVSTVRRKIKPNKMKMQLEVSHDAHLEFLNNIM